MQTNAQLPASLKPIRAFIEARATLDLAEIFTDFQAARRRLQIPPYAVTGGRVVSLPPSFFCPECSSRLAVELHEWEQATGRVSPGGYTVFCRDEEASLFEIWARDGSFQEERDVMHRYWQSDWMPLQDRAGRWLLRTERVYD